MPEVRYHRVLLLLCSLLWGAGTYAAGQVTQQPQATDAVVAMYRLTQSQYRQSVADIFGDRVRIYGRFEPDYRRDHLLATGSAWASVSPSGFEQYEQMARGIAEQVLGEEHRQRFLACEPGIVEVHTDTCIRLFLAEYGEKLFRRPLTAGELASRLEVVAQVLETGGDVHDGLQYALASLLVSPEFLFRIETVEQDPRSPGQYRLTAYSKAARLSFFLWNTTPDAQLLAAAQRGALHDDAGLRAEVKRLLASPRLETGMRSLFADMLRFDTFPEVSKDAALYPVFTSAVAEAMQEQTLQTLVQHLLVEDADYRELFTRASMPMDRRLGMVYAVPVVAQGWDSYQFGDASARGGLLSQASLLSLHAHAGSSSPTLRGLFVRETFLCQIVPPPPADVDFTLEEAFAVEATARERLQRHRSEPACAGCHQLMDPIGLTLEQFDGVGMFRTRENGKPIDVSGELDGRSFSGAKGLGQALSEHPRVPECLVDTVYRYAGGPQDAAVQRRLLQSLNTQFAESGYRLRKLLQQIAISEDFYAVSLQGDRVL
ncbi:MAG: hypothetical protein CME59_22045 [Halioglobus sp.]|nr:hypothetical protein [Halioglobus sp.]|tara:strand:- start:441 stop:2072 length:1632 start_codon:yes stop_codon:yes gene_type:complete